MLRLCPLVLMVGWPHTVWGDSISYGDGLLTLSGAGYTGICLAETIDLQNYPGWVSGQLDLRDLNSPNVETFFEIGILAEGQYSFWHTSKGDPEDVWDHGTDHFEREWFNHGIYLLGMEWNNPSGGDYYWLYPQGSSPGSAVKWLRHGDPLRRRSWAGQPWPASAADQAEAPAVTAPTAAAAAR